MEHVSLDIMDFWALVNTNTFLPLYCFLSSFCGQKSCKMGQSHIQHMTLVSPDLVAHKVIVNCNTQTNPGSNTTKHQRHHPDHKRLQDEAQLSVYSVFFFFFKLEKANQWQLKLLNSLPCTVIPFDPCTACACWCQCPVTESCCRLSHTSPHYVA